MEYVIGAVALGSLFLNILVYRRLLATEATIRIETWDEDIEAETPEPPVNVPVGEDIYMSRALPGRPISTSGPLERPGGFAL